MSGYKETPEEIASEDHGDLDEAEILLGSDEELEFEDDSDGESGAIALENLDVDEMSKSKTKPCFSLKARRAIEDHLEKRRLRKELDYLFDDDFSAEDTDNPTKES